MKAESNKQQGIVESSLKEFEQIDDEKRSCFCSLSDLIHLILSNSGRSGLYMKKHEQNLT